MLKATLDWESKDQYLELIERLISGIMTGFQFSIEFQERSYLNGKVFESLKENYLLFSPHEKSKEFSCFIDDILDVCYSYEEVVEFYFPEEEWKSYQFEFRRKIKKIYLEMLRFLCQ